MTNSKLTPKQKRFVEEYIIDFNGKQAAIRAGYSESGAQVAGSRLLTNDKVKKEIELRKEKITEKCDVNAEMVVKELARIAFADISKLVTWDNNGCYIQSSDSLDENITCAVQEVVQVSTDKGSNVKVKMFDKKSALECLGKYLGMFTERHHLTSDQVITPMIYLPENGRS